MNCLLCASISWFFFFFFCWKCHLFRLKLNNGLFGINMRGTNIWICQFDCIKTFHCSQSDCFRRSTNHGFKICFRLSDIVPGKAENLYSSFFLTAKVAKSHKRSEKCLSMQKREPSTHAVGEVLARDRNLNKLVKADA